MRIDEYTKHDAVSLARLVRDGEIGATELAETAILAIEQVNGKLNAVVGSRYDKAREEIAAGLPEGPFSGVPFLLKDMVELSGEPATYGSVLARGHVAHRTHELVKRYLRAGLVPLGRTNMSELGLLPTTENSLFGPTNNPWNLAHSPGGSSGGAAAMVAAGAVPAAHGADGGGSIRIPASACGVVGLKPSRGRHPTDAMDDPDGFISQHVLSRSVRDSAALLDVICGPQKAKRFWVPPPSGSYLQATERPPGKLRIAFGSDGIAKTKAHPDCRAAVEHAARLLDDLGHELTEVQPEIDGESFFEGFAVLWAMAAGYFLVALRESIDQAGAPPLLARLLKNEGVFKALSWYAARAGHAPFEAFTQRLLRINARNTPADLWLAWTKMQAAGDLLSQFLTRYDLQLTPVLGAPPWPTGHLDAKLPDEALFDTLYRYTGYTPLCNTTGLPAISLPLHWNDAGLPIGVQLIAPFGREDRLLAVAAELERAHPWAHRRPPIRCS